MGNSNSIACQMRLKGLKPLLLIVKKVCNDDLYVLLDSFPTCAYLYIQIWRYELTSASEHECNAARSRFSNPSSCICFELVFLPMGSVLTAVWDVTATHLRLGSFTASAVWVAVFTYLSSCSLPVPFFFFQRLPSSHIARIHFTHTFTISLNHYHATTAASMAMTT